jgi:predicted AAA+ superfamily ATPase
MRFCLGQVVEHLGAKSQECFFWATHAGAELDLLVVRGAERRGFEFKRTTAPVVTRSMRTAVQDLKLESLEVIHAGQHAFQLAPKVRAVPLDSLLESVRPLRGTRA